MLVFPRLYTDRLILRQIQGEDIPSLIKYANNKKIADQIVNISFPYREPEATLRIGYVMKGFKNKSHYAFAIVSKEREELIGEISLHLMDKQQRHAQLAYWLGEDFWNQGMTTEAAKAVVAFGFKQLNLDLIYADCFSDNLASQKVMKNIGMTPHPNQGNLLLFKVTSTAFQEKLGEP